MNRNDVLCGWLLGFPVRGCRDRGGQRSARHRVRARPTTAGLERLESRALLAATATTTAGMPTASPNPIVAPVNLANVTVVQPLAVAPLSAPGVPLPTPALVKPVPWTPGPGKPAPRIVVPGISLPMPVAVRSVPGVPTGITGIPGDGNVRLSWTAPTSSVGAAISDYVVQVSSNAGATWTTFTDGVSAATSATVTGLTNGTSYVFRVAAANAAGTGAASIPSTAIVPLPPTPPPTPTGVTVASSMDFSATLSWDDVAGESGYRIERSGDYVEWLGSDYATWTEAGRTAADATTFTDAGLEEGSTFSYRVIAVNAAGASAPGAVVAVTTKLRAPDGVVATVIDGGRIDLAWTDRSSREEYYSVEQFVPEWNTWASVSGTPLGSTGMMVSGSFLPSTTYQFRIRAESSSWWYGQGESSDDVLVSVTTPAFPSAPGEVTAIAVSHGVRLSWEFRPDVTVVVERMSGFWGASATVAEITSAESSYEDYDYGLKPSTAYVYRIAFRNAHGTSGFSPTVWTVTTAEPRVAALYRSPSVVFVDWTSVLEPATGIVIERATSGTDAWTEIATLAGNATGYNDTAVVPGTSYRYRISFEQESLPAITRTSNGTGPEPRDSDGDGLNDGEELAGGTNPEAFSSDDDMLGDGFELANGLDPFKGDEDGNGVWDQHDDFDGDGLTNFQEALYGTSSLRTDTNGDGMPDGVDTDGDGVSDGVEAAHGSDPTNLLDQGLAPEPEERIKLRLTVGDPSGSHSEQWALQVGTLIQESPDYGLVGSGMFWFDVGRSYPVTLRHRGSLYGSDPDYDWYADIEATDPSDFFVVDTNRPLYLVGPYQGDWMNPSVFRSLEATLHIPRFDVDVDSKNDSGFAIPDDNRAEDRLENDGSTGKLVFVGADLVPMAVRLSENVAEARPTSTEVYFDYDPTLFRLWKNAGTDRTPGDIIPAGTWVNAEEIGLTPGVDRTVYVEALEGSTGAVPITTSVKVQGERWSGTLKDTVHLLPVEVDLDVDSDNDDRLATPKRDDKEEHLEASTPKPIVVNDNDTDVDRVPGYADWNIADKRFTPLVIQIPVGLPLASMQVTVSYAASDPALIGTDYRLPADSAQRQLRIWTKNAGESRNTASVTAGGSFVPSDRITDLSKLGFTDSIRTVELYVEGIQTTAGVSLPISIELIVGDRVVATDLVTVVVVSNTLVIGIDGTDTRPWLTGANAKRANGLWNSHVRNLVDEVELHAMTIYRYGPDREVTGADSDDIQLEIVARANEIIKDAGGGTKVALVGWSRGAMIALWAANELSGPGAQLRGMTRTVEFVGLYDPVDMSADIPNTAAEIHPDTRRVTIVGPEEAPDNNNVDYPVGLPSLSDPVFVRMAQNDRITSLGSTTLVDRYFYNASHGAIGGCPGYNVHLVSIPDGSYDYVDDVRNSIRSDRNIRNGMRAAGLDFVPDRDDPWYGFPATRPVIR